MLFVHHKFNAVETCSALYAFFILLGVSMYAGKQIQRRKVWLRIPSRSLRRIIFQAGSTRA